MSGSRAGRWRYYDAYVYVPKFRLFEVGEVLGVLEEEPSLHVLDSLPVSRPPDGSVLISPRNARRMVARGDYANYRNYAYPEEETPLLDDPSIEDRTCPHCGTAMECVNPIALSFMCEACLSEDPGNGDCSVPSSRREDRPSGPGRGPRSRNALRKRRRKDARAAAKAAAKKRAS
jgi:hypothetical protein